MVARSSPRDAETIRSRLDEADRLQAEFLATVAHEIRDPMTSCIGFAEMLLHKGDRMSEEERREALETIAKTGRRLVHLLEDILDASRLDTGAAPFVMRPVDLNEIVQDVLAERHGRDETVTEFDLADEHVVEADRDRMHQVVANLVANAVKFSPNGSPVRIAIRGDEEESLIAVQDRGIGIAPEDVPKLFGKFVRIPQRGMSERIPGTGLGLYISKAIVDAHRGRIWVESEPGRGSTFFVALPVTQRARG